MCHFCSFKLVFTPHLRIVVQVKALGSPYVITLVVRGKQMHVACKQFCSKYHFYGINRMFTKLRGFQHSNGDATIFKICYQMFLWQ